MPRFGIPYAPGRRTCRLATIWVVSAIVLSPSSGLAGTFSAPLTGWDQPNSEGDYLTGDFDFGRTFSEIESVALEIVMPDGYEGFHVTTGNSSASRTMRTIVHDSQTPLDLNPDLAGPSTTLSQQSSYITPGLRTPLGFFASNSVCFGFNPCPPANWPDFLLSGHGRVSLVDVNRSWTHPLPLGVTVGSSTSYGSPGEIASAHLIIVGTPAPEPDALVMFVLLSLYAGRVHRSRRAMRSK